MSNERLGARLQQLRGDRTQEEIARRVGVSRELISQLELGRKKRWSMPLLNALADALDIPVTVFLRDLGANIPEATAREEEAVWLASQLDDAGMNLWLAIGRELLPLHRRRPTGEE